jgi:D-cysteine desulfhydrase family pyridoxal phosphate-dependent enzyme
MTNLPCLELAHLPTPLEPALAMGKKLGISLFIKRDDQTGLAMGGSKARKLGYLVADARARGADTLVTFGGVQSNHARITAAAAARAGMRCHLLLGGKQPETLDGNLLLDHLLGAERDFLGLTPRELTATAVQSAYDSAATRLKRSGRTPYIIPPGGSGSLGVAAYLFAFQEIMEQAARLKLEIESIVVGFGTGGTLAGLALGNILAGRPVRVFGISSAPPGMPESLGVADPCTLAGGAWAMLQEKSIRVPGIDEKHSIDITEDDFPVDYSHAGPAYGAPTSASSQAIYDLARSEALLLDPVYTAKAMAGLCALASEGTIGRHGAVIFVHTGGTPALFPYSRSLVDATPMSDQDS